MYICVYIYLYSYIYIYIYVCISIYLYITNYIYSIKYVIYIYIIIVCDHEITHKLSSLPREDICKTLWPRFVDGVQLPQG